MFEGFKTNDHIKDILSWDRNVRDRSRLKMKIACDVLFSCMRYRVFVEIDSNHRLRGACQEATPITFSTREIQYVSMLYESSCIGIAMQMFVSYIGLF